MPSASLAILARSSGVVAAAAGAAGAGDGSDLMAHESVAPFDLMGAGANGPRSARHVALFDGAAV